MSAVVAQSFFFPFTSIKRFADVSLFGINYLFRCGLSALEICRYVSRTSCIYIWFVQLLKRYLIVYTNAWTVIPNFLRAQDASGMRERENNSNK